MTECGSTLCSYYRQRTHHLLVCLACVCVVHVMVVVVVVVEVVEVVVVVVVAVVVGVAFSSRARILGECSTIHSPPVLFFFFK